MAKRSLHADQSRAKDIAARLGNAMEEIERLQACRYHEMLAKQEARNWARRCFNALGTTTHDAAWQEISETAPDWLKR